jgi:regulator of sigma E protease
MTPNPSNGNAEPGQENLPEASWMARNGPFLVLALGLVLYLIYRGWDLEDFWTLGKVIFGLGLVIFLHELGHFAVAKWCNVKVMTFSLGFGPALPGCSYRWGETTYKISLLPIGGYVNMLGEGNEGDEQDVDPRSYKNKSVWQRMAIISAGVTMNVILALVCFIFVYSVRGAERIPAMVDLVDSGSPLWQVDTQGPDGLRGVHRGQIIRQIGNHQAQPPFPFVWFDNDLMPVVMFSSAGEVIPLVYSYPTTPERDWTHTSIEPRMNKQAGDEKPVIGLGRPSQLMLPPQDAQKERPDAVVHGSPAADARLLTTDVGDLKHSGFWFDDEVVGCTDPDHPDQVTELPLDPTDIAGKRHDYFAFQRRMMLLAGKPAVIRVRRAVQGDPGEDNAVYKNLDFEVGPAYRYVLGLRMVMGPVAAVRYPAKDHGVQPNDTIDFAQVRDGDRTLRWVTTRTPKEKLGANVEERDLDPDRLPFELNQWAARQPRDSKREVTFSLRRPNAPPVREAETLVEATVPWDDSWRFNSEVPIYPSSPLSLPCLGIAYRIKTTVKAVDPGGPAADVLVEEPGRFKYRDGDMIQILAAKDDTVSRKGAAQELTEGELFSLKPGDEVNHAGAKFTVARDSEVSVAKGDRISLREEDVVQEAKQYSYKYDRKTGKSKEEAHREWIKLTENQWANVLFALNEREIYKLSLKVKRDSVLQVTIQGVADKDWPIDTRGLLFIGDSRICKARNFGDAIMMGLGTTQSFMKQVFGSFKNLFSGRLPLNNFAGPIGIGVMAFSIAGHNIYHFILFLGIISVNLAVVNFLPIPVLDGGHMVFLTWEAIRGKPASERVRGSLTWVGLGLIACLMLLVICVEFNRYVLKG